MPTRKKALLCDDLSTLHTLDPGFFILSRIEIAYTLISTDQSTSAYAMCAHAVQEKKLTFRVWNSIGQGDEDVGRMEMCFDGRKSE